VVATPSGQGTSHSVNCDDLAVPLLTVAAGYRVSGFVRWHIGECSELYRVGLLPGVDRERLGRRRPPQFSSVVVKGFGYRPITTVGRGSRRVSGSLQGRNPREMRKRLCRKLYGDFWFLVGVGENGFEKGASVEVMWKEAGGFRRMRSTRGIGFVLWGACGPARQNGPTPATDPKAAVTHHRDLLLIATQHYSPS
jgi:hypothetical protein